MTHGRVGSLSGACTVPAMRHRLHRLKFSTWRFTLSQSCLGQTLLWAALAQTLLKDHRRAMGHATPKAR